MSGLIRNEFNQTESGSSSSGWRLSLYRRVAEFLFSLGIDKRRGALAALPGPTPSRASGRGSLLWFHAASAGELESLWTVIASALGSGCDVRVSVFSKSAHRSIERLVKESSALGPGKIIAAGYSPAEGSWKRSLLETRPTVFLTAKYEAWPDLWASLSELGVPLMILGAKPRSSFRWAKRVLRILNVPLPRLVLLPFVSKDVLPLNELFPHASVERVDDPRWQRASERALRGSARSREISQALETRPRPMGILGSAWIEDLAVTLPVLAGRPGTWVVVPHDVSPAGVQRMEAFLSREGWECIRTSRSDGAALLEKCSSRERGARTGKRSVILVDELGFLSELYGVADWAFVGGGFHQGLHSVIEPAVHGIPVSSGPNRAEMFDEVAELQASRQLRICQNSADFAEWIRSLPPEQAIRDQWLAAHSEKRQAAQRVMTGISSRVPLELLPLA